jgi:hypothetical protein
MCVLYQQCKEYVMGDASKLHEIRDKFIRKPNGGEHYGGQGVDSMLHRERMSSEMIGNGPR